MFHEVKLPHRFLAALFVLPVLAFANHGQRRSEKFLTQTDQGRVVLAYLRCSDLDCVESLEKVVQLGAGVVPRLVELLRRPVPRTIAPDLPKEQLAVIVRTRVIHALGDLKDQRAVSVLLEMAREATPQIRAASAEALGKIGGDRAGPALIPLLKDEDQLVREMAAKSLGQLKHMKALAALQEALGKETKPHVRAAMEAAIKSIAHR